MDRQSKEEVVEQIINDIIYYETHILATQLDFHKWMMAVEAIKYFDEETQYYIDDQLEYRIIILDFPSEFGLTGWEIIRGKELN